MPNNNALKSLGRRRLNTSLWASSSFNKVVKGMKRGLGYLPINKETNKTSKGIKMSSHGESQGFFFNDYPIDTKK